MESRRNRSALDSNRSGDISRPRTERGAPASMLRLREARATRCDEDVGLPHQLFPHSLRWAIDERDDGPDEDDRERQTTPPQSRIGSRDDAGDP